MNFSISIKKRKGLEMVDSLTLNNYDNLVISDLGFPRIGTYDDAETKMRYAISLMLKKKINKRKLFNILKDLTGANVVKLSENISPWDEVENGDIIRDEEVEDFIFNPKSLLVIYK